MKKYYIRGSVLGFLLAAGLFVTFSVYAVDPRVLIVPQGGTGFSSTSPNAIITAGRTATSSLIATSSQPLYIGSLNATTTATSTFAGGIQAASLNVTNYATITNASIGGLTPGNLRVNNGFIESSGNLITNGGTYSLGTGIATTTLSSSGGFLGISTTTPGSLFSIQGVGNFVSASQATSTLYTGLSSSGYLATTSGITITGGNILSTVSGTSTALTGNLSAAGISASNGLTISAGNLFTQTTGTSTVVQGLSATGISASAGLSLTGGGFRNTVSGTSTLLTGNLDAAGVTASNGLTLTGGNISTASTNLTIQPGGNNHILLNPSSTGNVGIGTTSPGSLLSVSGSSGLGVTNTGAGSSFYVEDVANDTSPFVIDATGNVGVGVTNPSVGKLQINTGAASNNVLTLQASSQTSGTYGLGIDSSSNFAIYDNANTATRLVITTAGNVGIGTTGPTEKLDVAGAIRLSGSTAGLGTEHWIGRDSGGNLNINWPASQNLLFAINNSEKVRIDSSGNVGIGTTSPTNLFSVHGGATDAGSSNYVTAFFGSAQTSANIKVVSTQAVNYLGTDSNGDNYIGGVASANSALRIFAGSNERVRITSTGNVGIGTTSPGAILAIKQAAATSGILLTSSSDGDYRHIYMDSSSVMNFLGDGAGTSNTATLAANGTWTNAPSFSWLKEQRAILTRDEVLGVLASTTIERFKIKAEVAQYGSAADLQIGIILDEAHPWLSDHNAAGEIVGYSPMRTASVAFRAAQIFWGDIQKIIARISGLEARMTQQEKINQEQQKRIELLESRIK